MQREIEALLTAYLADRNRETQMIQDLLTALAVGASARQRMVRDIVDTMLVHSTGNGQGAAPVVARGDSAGASSEISAAIEQLRAARGANPTSH